MYGSCYVFVHCRALKAPMYYLVLCRKRIQIFMDLYTLLGCDTSPRFHFIWVLSSMCCLKQGYCKCQLSISCMAKAPNHWIFVLIPTLIQGAGFEIIRLYRYLRSRRTNNILIHLLLGQISIVRKAESYICSRRCGHVNI